MKTWWRGVHLRTASNQLAQLIRDRPDCRDVKVHAEAESRNGYALVVFVRPTRKGKYRVLKFALHWDGDGRRLALMKGGAYESGPILDEREVPGDMVHPWLTAATNMLADLSEREAERARKELDGRGL